MKLYQKIHESKIRKYSNSNNVGSTARIYNSALVDEGRKANHINL